MLVGFLNIRRILMIKILGKKLFIWGKNIFRYSMKGELGVIIIICIFVSIKIGRFFCFFRFARCGGCDYDGRMRGLFFWLFGVYLGFICVFC